MSAAEKLEALEAQPNQMAAAWHIAGVIPQIVAVVQAAEQAQRILPKSAGSVSEWNSIAHIEGALTAALAALDEVLTVGGKTPK